METKKRWRSFFSKRFVCCSYINIWKSDLIRRAIKNCNQEEAFFNTNVNEKVFLLKKKKTKKTIFNVPNNYIAHETIIHNDKDPPRFHSQIKSLLHNKNKLLKNYQMYKTNTQLLSKQTSKKPPLISPLHENKFAKKLIEKAELFNSFFAKQYSLIKINNNRRI